LGVTLGVLVWLRIVILGAWTWAFWHWA
jgi:hypothetical protein